MDCSLWTPFSRCHTAGKLYASDGYISFASKEDGCCNILIPLTEVGIPFIDMFGFKIYYAFERMDLIYNLKYFDQNS